MTSPTGVGNQFEKRKKLVEAWQAIAESKAIANVIPITVSPSGECDLSSPMGVSKPILETRAHGQNQAFSRSQRLGSTCG